MLKAQKQVTIKGSWGTSTLYNPEYEGEPDMSNLEEPNEEQGQSFDFTVSELHDELQPDNEFLEKEDPSLPYYMLPYFYSSLFGTILEDSITQLRIIYESNNQQRLIKIKSDWMKLVRAKYGVELPKVEDELEGIDPHNLNCDEYKINKLDFDRKYAQEVVTAVYIELSLKKSFKTLTEYIQRFEDLDNYRVFLEEDEAKNKITRRELNRQIRQQRNHIKSVIYDCDVKIDELRTLAEDSELYAETRSRYVGNWQNARAEQLTQQINDKEIVSVLSIENYKLTTEREQRIHSEIELLTNILISEILEKVEQWMNKYDTDIEAIDLKIQIKKNDYQNMRDKRIELDKTIEEHDTLIKNWIAFKDERERARLYRELMTKSAITVQAWWRGMLVRRRLGPYKKSAKKGDAAKKKK